MRTAPHLIFAFLLSAALACSSIKPLKLTAAESGRTIELVQGQELVLTLESNRSTGYRWWLADSTEVVLVPAGLPKYARNPTSKDGGGVETWRFQAARVGKETLRFEYKRSVEDEVDPAKRVSYTVVVVK